MAFEQRQGSFAGATLSVASKSRRTQSPFLFSNNWQLPTTCIEILMIFNIKWFLFRTINDVNNDKCRHKRCIKIKKHIPPFITFITEKQTRLHLRWFFFVILYIKSRHSTCELVYPTPLRHIFEAVYSFILSNQSCVASVKHTLSFEISLLLTNFST